MRIQFTPSARDQFLSRLAYIKRENPQAAVRFRKRAEKILRRLERFPELGRRIPEFPDLPYREIVVPPYRFFIALRKKEFGLLLFGTKRNCPASHSYL